MPGVRSGLSPRGSSSTPLCAITDMEGANLYADGPPGFYGSSSKAQTDASCFIYRHNSFSAVLE